MATEEIFYSGDYYGSVGDLYDPSGYTVADGTSFAAPFTAGVAAVIKSARPGLSMDQYRSLVINSAKGMLDPNGNLYAAQQIGGGLLNALNAYSSPATVLPTNLGMGAQSNSPNNTQTITLTNVSQADDSFSFSFASSDGIVQPIVPGAPVAIGAGQSQSIPITFAASGLNPGAYQGSIIATSAVTGANITIPYWFAVPSDTPAELALALRESSDRQLPDRFRQRGATYLGAFDVRITDAAGVPITDTQPTVTVLSGGGRV